MSTAGRGGGVAVDSAVPCCWLLLPALENSDAVLLGLLLLLELTRQQSDLLSGFCGRRFDSFVVGGEAEI